MLACMAQAGLWGVASCHHLQVGHTHEDVDSIFSLVAMALGSSACLQTPMDVAKRIESKLSHLWTSKGLVFSIEIVDTVTQWLDLIVFTTRDASFSFTISTFTSACLLSI